MKQKTIRIVMGIVCLVLALAITIQLRTMKEQNSDVSQSFANDELKDSLLQWKERYEKATQSLQDSSKELENARTEATTNDSNSKEKTDKLNKNNVLLGLTDVSGDGLLITANDSKITASTDDISKYLVHDGDLREIVNELTNAGAEAISINDERIVSSTCIICAGNVISINGEKVSAPFTIKAIGNQESLYGAITRSGGYIQYMKAATIPVEVKKTSNIQIKKFSGALTQKYIKTRGE